MHWKNISSPGSSAHTELAMLFNGRNMYLKRQSFPTSWNEQTMDSSYGYDDIMHQLHLVHTTSTTV